MNVIYLQIFFFVHEQTVIQTFVCSKYSNNLILYAYTFIFNFCIESTCIQLVLYDMTEVEKQKMKQRVFIGCHLKE